MTPALLAGTKPPANDYAADIVILSHHRLAETLLAIGSAKAQSGGAFHVTVLDQASPPDMRAALAAAIGASPGIALYAIGANLGVGGGRNLAATLGHGAAIIALDNDAVFERPDITARAAKRLAASPGLGAIAFRILAADGRHLDETSWGYPKSLIPRAAETFPVTTFVGCGHAISRACWNALGGYDASLFFTWEEYEFSRRAIAAGWRIEHHGDLAVIHVVAAEARMRWSETRWRRYVHNRLLIGLDWQRWPAATPRALAYLAQGLRSGLLRETLHGIAEARAAARSRPRHIMPRPMRAYLHRHETAHRLAALMPRGLGKGASVREGQGALPLGTPPKAEPLESISWGLAEGGFRLLSQPKAPLCQTPVKGSKG